MTIRFTEDEWENIDKIPFAWRISENCPDGIRKTLAEKLKLLEKETENPNKPTVLSDDKKIYIAKERG